MSENAQAPRVMSGAELKALLKSSIHFKSLGGLKCDGLKASQATVEAWRDLKLGMFIHWGLYSMLGRGEWVMHNESIPPADYARLANDFRPRQFDASAWSELARQAGMRYMVLTARHHDGFSLWDSPGSHGAFTSMATGARRDFIREYTDACRASGLKVGLYYSPMDWRFPGYFEPKELLENALLMKQQTHDQVAELTSRYGPIDILWYDGAWLAHQGSDPDGAWLWDPIALNTMVKRHNPRTMVNPRSGWEGDFLCDEGSHEIVGQIIPMPWEKNLCLCSGSSWGWIPDDPVTPFDDVIRMIVNVVVRGGNVLLNVGPDADGVIPAAAAERLREVGAWMKTHGEAMYGTRAGPYQPVDRVFGSVFRERRAYLHILDTQAFAGLSLPDVGTTAVNCTTLDGKPLPWTLGSAGLRIDLPPDSQKKPDTVVVIEFDAPLSMPEAAFELKR